MSIHEKKLFKSSLPSFLNDIPSTEELEDSFDITPKISHAILEEKEMRTVG